MDYDLIMLAITIGFGLSSGVALIFTLLTITIEKAIIAYHKFRDPFYFTREYRDTSTTTQKTRR